MKTGSLTLLTGLLAAIAIPSLAAAAPLLDRDRREDVRPSGAMLRNRY